MLRVKRGVRRWRGLKLDVGGYEGEMDISVEIGTSES